MRKKKEEVEFLSTITFITTLNITDREFGKGIEAHPAPDMSKQLEALQLAHTDEREKANSRIFRRVPEKPYELTFHLTEKSKRTCESHIFY